MKMQAGVQASLILAMLGAFLAPWINLPFAGGESGVQYAASMALSHPDMLGPVLLLLIAAPLLAISVHFNKPNLALTSAAFALAFLVCVPGYLVALDLHTLPTYADNIEDYRTLKRFFNSFFTPNKGQAIALPDTANFDSLGGRLELAFLCLEWGWYISTGAAAILFMMTLSKARLRFYPIALLILATPLALTLYAPMQAAKYRQDAQWRLTEGNPASAFGAMVIAFKLDPLLTYSEQASRLFSQLNAIVFKPENPAAALYQSAQLETAGKRQEALDTLHTALQHRREDEFFPYVAHHTKRRLTILTDRVISRNYRHEQWDEALLALQEMLRVYPESDTLRAMASLAYIRQGVPESCLSSVSASLERIQGSSLRADLLATQGECLMMMGKVDQARQSFQLSIDADSVRNLRAVRGLSGS
ncbi:hypothetical protein O5O45_29360 [Hahella aquimaris]|uniref:tetratricopeptide repeat protein n=1 Tax=Hahella sp. HNIBRBA332 TaxID=3015983 RepID=UPI00273C8A2F|nr:hypothetical protein [Hahella sp. HNIBRBA332]WLQ13834.1 hypothetical protein O5O45_29360 [Hahella sp. HNIBRBA332]